MKVSREQVEENRERILETASKLFKERGFDGVGLADLMKEAGLTHGAFYGHFASKEDLIAQVTTLAMGRAAKRWEQVIGAAKDGEKLRAMTKYYLSQERRDDRGTGCLCAATGTELALQAPSVREAATKGLELPLEMLEQIVPGKTKAERRKRAIATYASYVGGMVLARMVNDPELSAEILKAVSSEVLAKEVA